MTDVPCPDELRACHVPPSDDAPPLFELGAIVATPAAYRAMQLACIEPQDLLRRHVTGDWCEMTAHDREANQRAPMRGERVFSSYTLTDRVTVWVITEADRSSTCLLLPSDY